VCLLAALGTLNTAIINPAYVPMAKEFHITTVRASYQTWAHISQSYEDTQLTLLRRTVVIALNGVGPFLWIPLANKWGRRPIYLFTTLLGFCSALGCAFTKNFSQLLVARVFNGFFPSAMALGAVTVADMFFFHQRYIFLP
jgi:MFS family permease